jgi:pimeloyl-ACP methyl ester carboxylesterase
MQRDMKSSDNLNANIVGTMAHINNTILYYEEIGSGEPIVFSHGLLWSSSMFKDITTVLSQEFRCISYDHRGQGQSADHKAEEISIDLLCDDAIALIEHLDLGPVHFCGHSMGGFVALQIAKRRPDLLRSIMLFNTSADAEFSDRKFHYGLLNLFCRLFGPASVTDLVMPIMHTKKFLRDESRGKERRAIRNSIAGNRRTIWRAVNGVLNRASQTEHLSEISVPALIVAGENDCMRLPGEAERMASGIKNSKLYVYPQGGHMLPVEEPFYVTDAIREFLRS